MSVRSCWRRAARALAAALVAAAAAQGPALAQVGSGAGSGWPASGAATVNNSGPDEITPAQFSGYLDVFIDYFRRLPVVERFEVVTPNRSPTAGSGPFRVTPNREACLPPPRATPGGMDRWGLAVAVRPGTEPLDHIRVCRLRGTERTCFYDRPILQSRVSDEFVSVPWEADPDPRLDPVAGRLPRLNYVLEIDYGARGSGPQTHSVLLERKLAPLPRVTIVGPARAQGVATGGPFFTTVGLARFANARHLGLLGVRSGASNADSSFLESPSSALRAPPVLLTPVSPRSSDATALLCDQRPLVAPAFALWRGAGFPVRAWARAPLIDGCQLTATSETELRAAFTPASSALAVSRCLPRDPEQPTLIAPRPGTGGMSSGGGGGACVAGRPCMARPSECNSPERAAFEVAGVTRCTGGRETCVATERFCNSCGGDCGDCPGNLCSLIPSHSCGPGSVCGAGSRCFAIEMSRCPQPGPILCWKPKLADGSWPGRPSEVAFCGSDSCPRQCNGSTCGHDGCGGTCGTCAGDQACVARAGSPYGGTCQPRLPFGKP